MTLRTKLIVALCGVGFGLFAQKPTPLISVPGGTFVPLYGIAGSTVTVTDFLLDEHAVTNAQFSEFVRTHPKWKRGSVIKLFADRGYLIYWENDSTPGKGADPNSPVTNVSWFAAKAYCECQGKRLPTMNEWEYAAMASETKANAQRDSLFNLRIIGSYETPKTYLLPIKSTYRNIYGVWDLHGSIWEWTSDFNSVLISGESRKDGDTDRRLFCAGGSVNATNLMDYAAFMRYAFRGSLKGNYCIRTLGFRCAKNSGKP